jgi:hypothetical protein
MRLPGKERRQFDGVQLAYRTQVSLDHRRMHLRGGYAVSGQGSHALDLETGDIFRWPQRRDVVVPYILRAT